MTSLWTPDANEQALRVSEAIAAAHEDGRRQVRNHVAERLMNKWFPLLHMMLNDRQRAEMLLDLGATFPGIEPDSPADPEKTWSQRDSGE